jgi:hypothetical protein
LCFQQTTTTTAKVGFIGDSILKFLVAKILGGEEPSEKRLLFRLRLTAQIINIFYVFI